MKRVSVYSTVKVLCALDPVVVISEPSSSNNVLSFFQTIMEQFNPCLRNFVAMGKNYEKALASESFLFLHSFFLLCFTVGLGTQPRQHSVFSFHISTCLHVFHENWIIIIHMQCSQAFYEIHCLYHNLYSLIGKEKQPKKKIFRGLSFPLGLQCNKT